MIKEKIALELALAMIKGKIEGKKDSLANMGGDFPILRKKIEYSIADLQEVLDLINRHMGE